jgi:hypothetical protein
MSATRPPSRMAPRRLRLAVATALAALAGAAPVSAEPRPLSLAGSTTITASSPASIAVRVPRPATIETPFGRSADVRVVGGGDLVAFALVQEASDPFVLFGGRVPDGAAGTEIALPLSNLPERSGWSYDFVKNYLDETTIPAGSYTLYVFPGDEQASVTLQLDGLRGKTTLRPRGPADFAVSRPDPRLIPGGVSRNLYSAGDAHALTGTGLMFNALWMKTDPFVSGQFQFCHYQDEHPAEPVEYAPGCPNATQETTVNDRRTETEATTKLLYGGKSSLPPVRHGQGFWYATQGVVEDLGYVSLWLSYD